VNTFLLNLKQVNPVYWRDSLDILSTSIMSVRFRFPCRRTSELSDIGDSVVETTHVDVRDVVLVEQELIARVFDVGARLFDQVRSQYVRSHMETGYYSYLSLWRLVDIWTVFFVLL
jgi:hypothetical protein